MTAPDAASTARAALVPLVCAALLACPGGPGPSDGGGGGSGGGQGGGGNSSGPVVATSLNRSGTRLKATWTTSADGLKVFNGWRDSARGEGCYFNTAADGQLRCVPFNRVTISPGTFADAACTQPAALDYSATCSSLNTMSSTDFTVCPPRTRYFQKGSAVMPATYYAQSGGTCVSFTPPANARVWRVGAEIAAGSFIRAQPAPAVDAGALQLAFLDGEDGSRVFSSLRSAATGVDCYPSTAKDLQPRCLPVNMSGVSTFYADAACTSLAVSGWAPACPKPETTMSSDYSTCPSLNVVYAVGAATSSIYSRSGGGACGPATANLGYQYWAVGAEVAPSSFALGQPVSGGRFGRLDLQLYDFGGGAAVFRRYHDQTLDSPCSARDDSSGQSRCIPSGAAEATFFTDAACADRIAAFSGPCAPPSYGVLDDRSVCPTRNRVWRLGAQYTGPLYYRNSASMCTSLPAYPDTKYFRLGAEVQPSELAPLDLSVDP